jgi:P4 family phage/plasmid primase-like protien
MTGSRASDSSQDRPIAEVALELATAYVDAGWEVTTCKAGTKSPPDDGTTGSAHKLLSTADLSDRIVRQRRTNTALVMPAGLIGLDVDHYVTSSGKQKRGGDTIDALESCAGWLVPTWRSTSRQDDPTSGIRFYRLPDGLEGLTSERFPGNAPDVDYIRHEHRYAIVEPSLHPASGAPYVWYRPDGSRAEPGMIPMVVELPELTREHVDHIRGDCSCKGSSAAAIMDGSHSAPRGAGPAYASIDAAESTLLKALSSGHNRYDTMTSVTASMVARHCPADRLSALAEVYVDAVASERESRSSARLEWNRAVEGARQKGFASISASHSDTQFTDVGNAARFERLHGENVRFVHNWGVWITWDGRTWRRDPQGVVVAEYAKGVSRQMFASLSENPNQPTLASWAKRSASAAGVRAMVDLARGLPGLVIDADELDADFWALGVANGWIDLRTGMHHPPDPSKLITLTSPVEFDPDASCPRWRKALEEWLPDSDVRDYFQRLVGEALVGTVRDHILVIHYGGGGNGKGTAFGTLGRVLGPYYTVPHKSLLVRQRHDPHPTGVAALFRIRLAIASEADSADELSEEQVKELTGGDPLTARRMREDFWTFLPTHSLWLQTNHLPKVHGADEGLWRRIRVMPWPGRFIGAKADPRLSEKLEDEYPGILRWAVEGALKWQADGLEEPEAVQAATAEYRRSEDKLAQFFEAEGYELCPGDVHSTIKGGEATDRWIEWHRSTHGKAGRGNELAIALRNAGCEQVSKKPSIWSGIAKVTFDGC